MSYTAFPAGIVKEATSSKHQRSSVLRVVSELVVFTLSCFSVCDFGSRKIDFWVKTTKFCFFWKLKNVFFGEKYKILLHLEGEIA